MSLGVVLAALAMRYTGWMWLDPLVSLAIVVAIAFGTWSLLRESLDLALDAVPVRIDPEQVEAYLAGLPGVEAVHDLHIWGMSTTEAALTVHLVKPDATIDDALLARITRDLHVNASASAMPPCSSNSAMRTTLAGRRRSLGRPRDPVDSERAQTGPCLPQPMA